jgi:creatinine amidohydrolase
MAHDFARLSAAQLRSLPPAKTAFFFAVGALEDHGPHLPMGLDLAEAYEMCRRAAERLEREMPGWVAVMMPPAPLGLEANTGQIALTVRPHVLRDWLVDACRGLERAGFFHFVCFAGHLGPKQLTAIEEAGQMIRKSTRWIRLFRKATRSAPHRGPLPALISASSAQVTASTVWRSPIFLDAAEHGGRRDTSVALAIDPSSVDATYQNLSPQEPSSPSHWKRLLNHWKKADAGFWGKPSEANAGWGQGVLQGSIDEIFPKLKAALEGADPNLLFRSWYSVIPTNRTFFKAWLLAMGFAAILMAWIFLNLWNALSI